MTPPITAVVAFAMLIGHPILQMALIGLGARAFALSFWGRASTYISAAVAGAVMAFIFNAAPIHKNEMQQQNHGESQPKPKPNTTDKQDGVSDTGPMLISKLLNSKNVEIDIMDGAGNKYKICNPDLKVAGVRIACDLKVTSKLAIDTKEIEALLRVLDIAKLVQAASLTDEANTKIILKSKQKDMESLLKEIEETRQKILQLKQADKGAGQLVVLGLAEKTN